MSQLIVALLEPEIAGNAGNIARTCLVTNTPLHLIRPLGFRLSDDALKRAGMDYWHEVDTAIHADFAAFYAMFQEQFANKRVFSLTTKGKQTHSDTQFQAGDVLLFGPESRGLPESVRNLTPQLRIPMQPSARSLNLAVSVGVCLYEAWRQLGYDGLQ
jgi:tRNA (cytidine(34)-2'-O)-methyltransferase